MLRPLLISIVTFTLSTVSGCNGAVMAPPDRPPSHANVDSTATRLGRTLAPHTGSRVGASGFSLIQSGPEALVSLRSFIALAEKTLDLQYYSWRADKAGRLLMAELIAAAQSGVRVRLLLDDMDTEWTDEDLARVSALPNFRVRIFNPFLNRNHHLLDLLVDFDRVTHRMHNKLFVADNAVAIVGGRNIGDRYFSANEEANYRDIDLLAAGPIVRDLSRSFDDFWNSAWSVEARRLDEGAAAGARLASRLENTAQADMRRLPVAARSIRPADYATKAFSRLVWTANAVVLADVPEKARTGSSRLLEDLRARLAGEPDSSLLIETAYLIPGETGLQAICGAARKGVRLRILTNSFASTDAITAYAGYQAYRKPLLRCGVALYEMKPDGAFADDNGNGLGGSSSANLHSKAAVIDGRYVFVGSFNLDPRSVRLNTEIALLVDSPALAKVTAAFIEDGMSGKNAYRLELEDGEVVWHTLKDGRPVRLTEEPGKSLWDDIVSGFIGLLPIEQQL